ncbi:S-adenosyl-L-methionine-dependent methyltransferase [Arabidopsis suecica]|uniref:S-adenosyl-L-methionine-dependent methyltransferase n=2 Tax=Arabidopsis suecica TaxID=45249 RepID=A0A8T1XY49_ARASU|nr:S-adenosyl-L-methionine-dependent methyltransferase [Arabidopsis suecica]
MEETSKLQLPETFLSFLEANGLDPSIYTHGNSIPRYVRLKPGFEDALEEIESQINCKLKKVNWLPGFYSIPPDVHIARSKAYQQGTMYGIDAASGAAVSALGISPGDHVLDLCAAPGAKLCMMLDLLGDKGTATGVDVARHRLAACRTMLLKYGLAERSRLFLADGTTFSVPPTTNLPCDSLVDDHEDTFKQWTSRRPYKERKQEAKARKNSVLPQNGQPEIIFYGQGSGVIGLKKKQLYRSLDQDDYAYCGYDKVLVDAECTHDGSIKHIQKFEQWGWTTLERRVLDAERTDRNLSALQLNLLRNGFRLLKEAGTLVYSTCSLTHAQNEDVVDQFLAENSSAELQEIEMAKDWPCKSGRTPKTLRFDPSTSATSGLFVAKIRKLPSNESKKNVL